MDVISKRELLDRRLRELRRLMVAYSGGVDSAFLAWAAHQVLGKDMLAVIADSPSLARTQLEDAVAFAGEQGFPLEIIATSELERPEYARNDAFRCFHCKDELFRVLEPFARERGFQHIAYGVNCDDCDDQGDFRPGQQAAALHGIAAPLLEAGLSKAEIRELAHAAGLRVWDKPASACLSSRVEYGRAVTPEVLTTIEKGEDALRDLGFRQFRVRYHGETVRLEIACDEMSRAFTPEMAASLVGIFKGLGFTYVTLDLQGFRSGSMNALLPASLLARP